MNKQHFYYFMAFFCLGAIFSIKPADLPGQQESIKGLPVFAHLGVTTAEWPYFRTFLDEMGVDVADSSGMRSIEDVAVDVRNQARLQPFSDLTTHIMDIMGVSGTDAMLEEGSLQKLQEYIMLSETIKQGIKNKASRPDRDRILSVDDAIRDLKKIEIIINAGNYTKSVVDAAYKQMGSIAKTFGDASAALRSMLQARYQRFKEFEQVRAAIEVINRAATGVSSFTTSSIARAKDTIANAYNKLPESLRMQVEQAYAAFAGKFNDIAVRLGMMRPEGYVPPAESTFKPTPSAVKPQEQSLSYWWRPVVYPGAEPVLIKLPEAPPMRAPVMP